MNSTLRNSLCLFSFLLFGISAWAQPYTPVSITGFNHDVVAETGTSSLTTTTSALDGITVSNKVMYTVGFRTSAGLGGGGIADNGTFTSGADIYQLAAYNVNNALITQRSQNNNLNLQTPASYSSIRLLGFSTEGASLINVTLFFTDGSSTNVLTNYSLPDWFNGAVNVVSQGFGRVTRATPASGADAYPTNPRLYYVNINLTCADRLKTLQRINIANVTTAGSNAPFPNAVFFALSGRQVTQTITSSLVQATCNSAGSATVNVTGTASPFTVTWNTTPAQTGPTATNLNPGNYTATITDVNGCVTSYPVTITLNNNISLTTNSNTTICSGASLNANVTSNAATILWSPSTGVSNPNIANPVLTPATTTTYTVTATLGSCTLSNSFTVTVNPPIALTVHSDTTICLGASFSANTSGNASSYSWSPANGVSNTAIANPILSPTTTTTYTVTGTTGICSVTRSFTVTVVPGVSVSAGNDVTIIGGNSTILQGSGSGGTYTWTPATSLSSTSVLNPVASPTATITYTLNLTSAAGCTGSDQVTVTVIPYCIKPMNAITPNGDGINDRWLVTNGGCAISIRAKVFNRYGNLVYESLNYQNDWEGTYKGKPIPDGTYYFILEFKLIDGRTVPVKGDITVIR